MDRVATTLGVAGGVLAVLLSAAAATGGDAGPGAGPVMLPDSTNTTIELRRNGSTLRIRALFTGGPELPDALAYELSVRRNGAAGTTQTTQSGAFSVTPGRPDTLSTVTVNVQTGDRLRIHVRVRAGTRPVDTAHLERTLS